MANKPLISPTTGKPLPDIPQAYYFKDKLLMSEKYFPKAILQEISERELYPDDVILVGFPKSGKRVTYNQWATMKTLSQGCNVKL